MSLCILTGLRIRRVSGPRSRYRWRSMAYLRQRSDFLLPSVSGVPHRILIRGQMLRKCNAENREAIKLVSFRCSVSQRNTEQNLPYKNTCR